MKLLNLIALALLSLSVYAEFIIHPPVVLPDVPAYVAMTYPVTVTAEVIEATDVNAKVKVVVTNTASPTTMSVTATVNYQRWGFDEESVSLPVVITVQHPVTVKGINLSFPGDWVLITPFTPTTILDGQALETTLEYVKVTVRL